MHFSKTDQCEIHRLFILNCFFSDHGCALAGLPFPLSFPFGLTPIAVAVHGRIGGIPVRCRALRQCCQKPPGCTSERYTSMHNQNAVGVGPQRRFCCGPAATCLFVLATLQASDYRTPVRCSFLRVASAVEARANAVDKAAPSATRASAAILPLSNGLSTNREQSDAMPHSAAEM